ncbi:MAG TPA: ABC transporter substrate-binding protein [Gemmataceae bacterium]|jgi:ABC-type transport system substrate-binding protein|nr:ABC transporter substrate-binding protein [Gemmataceae bacterium]
MRASVSSLRWLLTFAILPLFLATLMFAQDKKKDNEEEEDAKAKPVKKLPQEEEDPKAKPVKKLPKEEEEPKVKSRPAAEGPIDLQKEAAQTTNGEVKKLFASLAHPLDRIQLKSEGWTNVTPLVTFVGDRPNVKKISYRVMMPDGKPDRFTLEASPETILSAVHFEQIAMNQVKDFLIRNLERKPGDKDYLPRLQQLIAADKALTFAWQFHKDARAKKQREGAGWDGVQATLQTTLVETLADELKELTIASFNDKNAGLQATDLAVRMGDLFPSDPRVHKEILIWKLDRPGTPPERIQDFLEGAQRFAQMTVQFPLDAPKLLEPVRERLRNRAQYHLDEARKLAGQPDGQAPAIYHSDLQMKIWPDIQGAKEFRTKLLQDFRMLVVGVRQLPELMSPALAQSDPDRWAVELLFEGLLQSVPDSSVGQRYRTQLAEQKPRMVPMGRQFQLLHGVVWETKDGPGEELKADAVKETIRLLQQHKGLPVAEGIDALKLPQVQDPHRFALLLERGSLEPLSSMTFKVLPAQLLTKQGLLDESFARQPVGTGPFVYHGRKTEGGKEYAVFKANPDYSHRPGHFGLPRIQEIRFVVPPIDPTVELREGKIDMLLDLPTAELVRLRNPDLGLTTKFTEVNLQSRRIWILAVNHRRPELAGQTGAFLRRALAYGIDRDQIVKTCFKSGTLFHRALRGPFPEDTWAVPADPAPVSLFQPEKVSTLVKQAKLPPALKLAFADNELAAKACGMIKQQLEQLNFGLSIELAPMPAAAFHKAVMLEHDYDLAYMPFDFQNELFSLAGLFDSDAQGRGERNFLGYTPDAAMASKVKTARTTRDYQLLSRNMHEQFDMFNKLMPFIPLWQLDIHILMNANVQPVPAAKLLDPLTIFDQVEEWRVNR